MDVVGECIAVAVSVSSDTTDRASIGAKQCWHRLCGMGYSYLRRQWRPSSAVGRASAK